MSETTQQSILQELKTRADHHAGQSRLIVDYYRIRRRLAYPLPVTELHLPSYPVALDGAYPWAIWLAWALEDRLMALGASATLDHCESHQALAQRDLHAMTGWPRFDQLNFPDLAFSHAMRCLHHAWHHWPWLEPAVRGDIHAACMRAVQRHVAWSDTHHAAFDGPADEVSPEVLRRLHNIPIIGAIGLALAARLVEHPHAAALARRALHLVLAILDARHDGHSEGVAYDGYVADFAADLLDVLDASQRQQLLGHAQLPGLLRQSIDLAAPGHMMEVAQIADVEPRQMPFHAGAHAKLLGHVDLPSSRWHLQRCPLAWLRSDALLAMWRHHGGASAAPQPGALDAHYATVLRTGWEHEDVAVAISATRSTFSHMHHDAGSLVVGTQGRWIIADPGYQQYLKKQERTFTLGACAHNAPLLNGRPQVARQSRVICRQRVDDHVILAAIDIRQCYDASLKLRHATRHVWLIGRQQVVVADHVVAEEPLALSYCWHAHPDAAWWVEGRAAVIHLPPTTLHLGSPQVAISESQIDRLPGSRGQLTLSAALPLAAETCCWWQMSLNGLQQVEIQEGGATLRCGKHVLRVDR